MFLRLKWSLWCRVLMLFMVVACKEPFNPEIPGEETGFLVVEGYINVGPNAITSIRLSRTSKVSQSAQLLTETGATVNIEDEAGGLYPLEDKGEGKYESAPLSLSSESEFRLSIRTKDGKQYYSEFEQSIVTPALDSVVWRRNDAGVGIYVNTHDPDNEIQYYQWDYNEVWEIWSPFHSFYEYKNGLVIPRPDAQVLDMFKCWKYDYPDRFHMESTAATTENAITMRPLIQIPVSAEKLSFKYSVIVRQHALTRQAFEYLQMMEKNTSSVGSYFDPLPSELNGNMYCATTNEPVVGYMGAYTTSEIRIFIRDYEVPNWNFSLYCESTFVGNTPEQFAEYFGNQGLIPTSSDGEGGNYFGSTLPCVDCRIRKGTNIRPPFW
jgi:hypothetical protein